MNGSRSRPLSSPQQAVWLDQMLSPDVPCYTIGAGFVVDGQVDLALWERAIAETVRGHDALRIVVESSDDFTLRQVIHDDVAFKFKHHDFSDLEDGEHRAWEYARAACRKTFALFDGVLWEMEWLQITPARALWLVRVHHLISDGHSIVLLANLAANAYSRLLRGQAGIEQGFSYLDFVAADEAYLASKRYQVDQEFWHGRLDAWPEPVFSRLSGTIGHNQTEQVSWTIARNEYDAMVAAVEALRFSSTHMLMAALATFFARTRNTDRVVIGMPVHNRKNAIEKQTLGMFSSMLPLSVKVDSTADFYGVLSAAAEETRTCYRHQRYPLHEMNRHLRKAKPLGAELFDIRLSVENFPGDVEVDGARFKIVQMSNGYSDVALSISVCNYDKKHDVRVDFNFNPTVLTRAEVERAIKGIKRLLSAGLEDCRKPLWQLPLLSTEERNQVVHGFNQTQAPYQRETCIHRLFEEQVRARPEAVALVHEDTQLSYGELNAQANRLAHHLIALGVHPDDRVAICLPRSMEMVVALLAVLKAGGAYVPLDPAYPSERLTFMLNDSAPRVVITQHALLKNLQPLPLCLQVLQLDIAQRPWETFSVDNPDPTALNLSSSHLAYVIYTSGSTGMPKGVMVEHRGLCNLALAQIAAFKVGLVSRVLQLASFSFDASVSEVMMALCSGARLYLPHTQPVGAALLRELHQQRITHVTLSPSVLASVSEEDGLETLQTLVLAGEASSQALIGQWAAASRNVFNAYGPTESTVCATIQLCDPLATSAPPIGRPIANTRIYILDVHRQPVPVGITGEIHIGGVQVARGYLNRPELTAERFLADPFAVEIGEQGARMYKTGDLGRWLPNGAVEYLGRNDFQVKLRGFRIELGEIEARLREHAGVREAVVLVREDVADDKRLVAYYTGAAQSVESLRKHLCGRLPEYMAPAAYLHLEQWPLTRNGKLDRNALPAPEADAFAVAAYEPPQGPIETALAEFWRSLLDVERIGRHDNFFALGGHSLLAVQLISRIRSQLSQELAPTELFEHPTLAGLAKRVCAAEANRLPAIMPTERDQPLPLSYAQQRLWFLCQLEGASAAYHMPAALRLRGRLEEPALHQAFDRIVQRHQVLRTTFDVIEGQPVQRIGASGFALQSHDLSQAVDAAWQLQQLVKEEAAAPFDLNSGPLLRGRLLKLGAQEHVLLVTMHHIVSDGWSLAVLVGELNALYAAYCQGEVDPLLPLPIQYADYAVWQRQYLDESRVQAQLQFWRDHLEGAPTLLELPTDQPRPEQQSYAGARLEVQLNAQLTQQLKALSEAAGATLFMTLLAGWAIVLSRLSGQQDVVIGTPVANRTRSEVESLIGFFVNTHALRVRLHGQRTVGELLQQVKRTAVGAQAHQDVPFEQVVEALAPPRSLGHGPLFQVMFAWQNTPKTTAQLGALQVEPLHASQDTAKFDLTLDLTEQGEHIVGSLEYATALFDQATVQRWVSYLHGVLNEMATQGMQVPLGQLSMLPPSEREQVIHGFNQTQASYPQETCIHALFEDQVRTRPEAVALVYEDTQLSYGELNAQANRLAHHLIALGVHPDECVAICLPRSIEMVVALLAVLKAGGAYVPLDPTYPPERLMFMVSDSAPRVLITQQALLERLAPLPASLQVVSMDIEQPWQTLSTDNPDPLSLGLTSSHLAYVIYTSGSTGAPKGVMVEHRNVVKLAVDRLYITLNNNDRVLHVSNTSFDAATFEIWSTLLNGAELIILDREKILDLTHFVAVLRSLNDSTIFITTALFNEVSSYDPGAFKNIKHLLFGGETANPLSAQRILNAGPPKSFLHVYGPTECTTFSSFFEVTPRTFEPDSVPIGRPIANTRIYILDAHGQPVPVGVSGEIYIGGAGVARGYLNRPELTAERFLPDPFAAEVGDNVVRMYKSGDVGRWLPDGAIEYLGRNDFQVKIRGLRIELGEIEARLREHVEVREAVVLAREDDVSGKRLVAYYTGEPQPVESLREHLSGSLPEYMVPAACLHLKQWPLTPNGKLDRTALPAPEADAFAATEYEPPQGPIEAALAEIWQTLLGLERIGRHDSFFDLGGHSLLAVQLAAGIRSQLGLELALADLFEHPTLAGAASRSRLPETIDAKSVA
jgi:amino acid adenylation domain-containing protein